MKYLIFNVLNYVKIYFSKKTIKKHIIKYKKQNFLNNKNYSNA
jgi:hypothetical protein